MSETLPRVPLRDDAEDAPAIDYRVHHLTAYRYARPVSRNYGRAHVEPRATPHQRVLSHEVAVDPTPARLTEHPQGSLARPWEQCTPEHGGPLMPPASIDFVHPSPRVPASRAARELKEEVFTPGRPVGEALAALTGFVFREFTYDAGATTVTSTLEEVLAARHGVCQDFAHVGVAAVRAAGLAARYVSGYLRTAPAADGALGTAPAGEMIGSAASHAWLSVLVPGTGWVDIDPTNNTFVDQRFVTTAWGRDYADVPPLKGIVVGPPGATSTLSVAVGVVPVTTAE